MGEETTGPGSDNWTPLDEISPYMQVAVLTTEDGGFLKHHGFNRASIRSSIVANLKARRFARGASTITMQLAKNLFLSRDKTLSRKLEEVVLTDYLEQTFSKDELMELYLNVIEFGPAVYGITAAAEHYFGRTPGRAPPRGVPVPVVSPARAPSLRRDARERRGPRGLDAAAPLPHGRSPTTTGASPTPSWRTPKRSPSSSGAAASGRPRGRRSRPDPDRWGQRRRQHRAAPRRPVAVACARRASDARAGVT